MSRFKNETARICDLLGSAVKAQPGYITDSRPHVAIHCASDMVRMAQELQYEAVKRAREEGCSWSEIAEALGVSKQAAAQKFGPMLSS